MSHSSPVLCTTSMARVRSVMQGAIVSALTLTVPGAVSAKTGIRPSLISPIIGAVVGDGADHHLVPRSSSRARASRCRAGVQPGVAMQCLTPRAEAKARSKRPTMSTVSPLSTTSWRYSPARGPMVRGKGVGSVSLQALLAAAPYCARCTAVATVSSWPEIPAPARGPAAGAYLTRRGSGGARPRPRRPPPGRPPAPAPGTPAGPGPAPGGSALRARPGPPAARRRRPAGGAGHPGATTRGPGA